MIDTTAAVVAASYVDAGVEYGRLFRDGGGR